MQAWLIAIPLITRGQAADFLAGSFDEFNKAAGKGQPGDTALHKNGVCPDADLLVQANGTARRIFRDFPVIFYWLKPEPLRRRPVKTAKPRRLPH
ncbi:MAG: hypothetical protein M1608_06430, partial [Candidatus Omnitrophica bacterium]|nr:hypothetical protein [Candidatus Omnitrophota bacterium]